MMRARLTASRTWSGLPEKPGAITPMIGRMNISAKISSTICAANCHEKTSLAKRVAAEVGFVPSRVAAAG